MRKAFLYRLYPTNKQAKLLNHWLEECRWLYNHFLEERKTAYETTKKSPSVFKQQKTLPKLKVERPSLEDVYSQVLQNVAIRLDLAFKAFFRRVKSGEKPGYPRFRGKDRYNSFTFPQPPQGCCLENNRLKISKVGCIKIKTHRPIEGTVKTVSVRKTSTGKWYVSFSCEVEIKKLPKKSSSVGIDLGLHSFATLNDGESIDNPRFFRKAEDRLVKVQRKLSKLKKGSEERTKQKKVVSRVHERIVFQRKDFVHQLSRNIVNRFGFIAVEDLEVNKMVHNRCLAKSISDVAWNDFASCLAYKAEWAGRKFVKVNPAYTSQDCSQCGHRQLMPLAERVYRCPCCNLEMNRDQNAARNILALGLKSLELQCS